MDIGQSPGRTNTVLITQKGAEQARRSTDNVQVTDQV